MGWFLRLLTLLLMIAFLHFMSNSIDAGHIGEACRHGFFAIFLAITHFRESKKEN